jgi:hypothetical protein
MPAGTKKGNTYARAVVGAIDAPKAVWIAIAVSLANQINGGSLDRGIAPIDTLMAEWQTLYDNSIVPQYPRRKKQRTNDAK